MDYKRLKAGECKRSDGRYMYRFTDDLGKRHCVYAKTLLELRKKEVQIQLDLLELSEYVHGCGTLNTAFDRYLSLKTNLRPGSVEIYMLVYDRHVRDSIGKKKLTDIRFSHIKQFYNELIRSGVGLPTVKLVHALIRPTLQLAVRDNIIRTNPSDGVLPELTKNPGMDSKKRHALTLTQQRAFLSFIETSPEFCRWYPMFVYMFGTGCRISEVIGIRWIDIDFGRKTISINHNLVKQPVADGSHRLCVSDTKTRNSVRVIPLLEIVEEALNLEKKYQDMRGEKSTAVIDGMKGFVFIDREGSPILPRKVNRVIEHAVMEHNEAEILAAEKEDREPVMIPFFTAHVIRHTFATRLCEHEDNLKVIQSIMGHANISTTMDVYADATAERNNATARAINASADFF